VYIFHTRYGCALGIRIVFFVAQLESYLLQDCTPAFSDVAHKAPSLCSIIVFLFQCRNTENTMDMKASFYVGTHKKKDGVQIYLFQDSSTENTIDMKIS
jgi:hypothetical protein